jgi:hypothetical protein
MVNENIRQPAGDSHTFFDRPAQSNIQSYNYWSLEIRNHSTKFISQTSPFILNISNANSTNWKLTKITVKKKKKIKHLNLLYTRKKSENWNWRFLLGNNIMSWRQYRRPDE